MDEQEKKPEGASPEETTKKVEGEVEDKNTDTKPDTDNGEQDIDFAKELEKVKKKTGQVQYNLDKTIEEKTNLKKENEELRQQLEGFSKDSDGKSLDEESIKSIIEENTQRVRKEMTANEAKRVAQSMSSGDDEFNLIMHHYENSLRLTGDIESDIANAHMLANASRIKSTMQELVKTAQSKGSRGKGGSAGQKQNQTDHSENEPSQKEKDFAARYGLTYDPKKGDFVKKQ